MGVRFSEDHSEGGYLIQRYGAGSISINDRDYADSLIVSPKRLLPHWRPCSAAELTASDLDPVLELGPQIVLLGTGANQIFPSWEIFAEAFRRGIGVEIMDTGAACRTYNILMSEGRQVAAALIRI